jgi:hypothetical protein
MSAKVHLLLFVIFIGILAFNSGLKTNNATSLKSSRAKASVGNLDSLKILERLTGEWAWDSSCYNQNKTTCYSSIHYRVVFFRNFKLKVFQHDSTIQTSNWIIQKEGNDFILSTNPCVDYVSGVVLINHGLLRMKDSKTGFEYYFSKKS